MVISVNNHGGAYVALRPVKAKRVRVVTPAPDDQSPEDQSRSKEPDDVRRRDERHAGAESGLPGSV